MSPRGEDARMDWHVYDPLPADRYAGWLAPGYNCTEVGYDIVVRSGVDDGIMEQPIGSNNGKRVGKFMTRFKQHPPQYWCGYWVMGVYADCGVLVPRYGWDCDEWLPACIRMTRQDLMKLAEKWKKGTATPGERKLYEDLPGAAILYGNPGDAQHIEIVTRVEPEIVWTRGGNRGVGKIVVPAKFNPNNGIGVFHAPTWRNDVLGVVLPVRRPDYEQVRSTLFSARRAQGLE